MYVTEERHQAIVQAVEEVKANFFAKEISKVVMQKGETEQSSSQLLAKFFKKPSPKAAALGEAQLKYEQMVHKAERKLYAIKRKSQTSSQSAEDRIKEYAKELFHKPGSLLSQEELVHIWQESGCQELRNNPRCNFPTVSQFRTIDGTCNNRRRPLDGAAQTPLSRLLPPDYEDGTSSLHGELQAQGSILDFGPFSPPYPSPRQVSDTVVQNVSQDELPFTHLLMQWGQFLDHDVDLSPELEEECHGCTVTDICVPIPVHVNDSDFGSSTFNSADCLPFRRSIPVCETTTPLSFAPREQTNDLTAFIDGSMIYGSDEETARQLRELRGGRLRTGENFPSNKPTLPTFQCQLPSDCFFCGDVRCNEQISLSIIHTLWLREHNLCAQQLGRLNSHWNDERIYQECRTIIGALIQKITYEDYLPKIFGPHFNLFIGDYLGYNEDVNPGIPNSFSTAAYRYGHTLIRPQFDRLDVNYRSLPIGPLNLVDAFLNPDQFRKSLGTDPIMRGWVSTNSRRVDEFLNSVLTSQLFETVSGNGMDLAALNMQRGRDHGLPAYRTWRNFCAHVFNVTSEFENELTLVRFMELYGTLDTIDLWIGGLAERRLPGSLLGATFACLFGITFQRVRDGDRFFYLRNRMFSSNQLQQIRRRTISKIICDNSDNIRQIQPDAFEDLTNQNRVRCNSLPSFDYSAFVENICYYRVQVTPRNRNVTISTFSRSGAPRRFVFTSAVVQPSTRNSFVCVEFKCPVTRGSSTVIIFSGNGMSNTRIVVNSRLSTEPDRRPNIYRANWNAIQGQSGLFSSLRRCQAASSVAITFNLPQSVGVEEAYSIHPQEMTVPDEVMDMLGEDENDDTTEDDSQAGAKETEETELSEEELLKEMEAALRLKM